MQIYVGTYKKYNEGSITGEWLAVDSYDTKEGFLEACRELHNDEDDAEFMFQDHEGIPEPLIGESWVSPVLFDIVSNIDNHTDIEQVWAFINAFSIDPTNNDATDILSRFDDAFCGEYDTFLDYAYEYIDSTGMLSDMPDSLQCYFDYESFARDLEMDYCYIDGIVFNNN